MNQHMIRDRQVSGETPGWLSGLEGIVGARHVHAGFAERLAYARDRAPLCTFRVRRGALPGQLPAAVVQPASHDEVAAIVRYARAERLRLIPYGAGSGVLCATVPLNGEVMVDLKRLSRIRQLHEEDGLVEVEAGKNGGRFEEELQARGYTVGHLPQSLHMSTVGGWAACRGAGQASSFYGKIEDIVVGLRAVMPDGAELDVRAVPRRAVGPSIKDLLVGSEGTLGIITDLTLRMWRLPEYVEGVVLGFGDLAGALRCMRRVMQAGLRPSVVRVYDEAESAARIGDETTRAARPILAVVEFAGMAAVARAERDATLAMAAEEGGAPIDTAPYEDWQRHRYHSYSPDWQARGYYMDTIEISAPWSRLLSMHEAMRERIRGLVEGAHFGAHWSHVYPEGACQYMTVRLPPMDEERAAQLHRVAWDSVQSLCMEMGGSISHHHGSGALRNPWMERELGGGLAVFQSIKDALDPDNLLNPGKLGLRPAAGSLPLIEEQA